MSGIPSNRGYGSGRADQETGGVTAVTTPEMTEADHVEALSYAEEAIGEARERLAGLYRARTAAVAAAAADGVSRTDIARVLGMTRPAVNKILAGQDGMPARKGWQWWQGESGA